MEYARGGRIEGGNDLPPIIAHGCDYIIGIEFAKRYAELEKLLEEINLGPEVEDGD